MNYGLPIAQPQAEYKPTAVIVNEESELLPLQPGFFGSARTYVQLAVVRYTVDAWLVERADVDSPRRMWIPCSQFPVPEDLWTILHRDRPEQFSKGGGQCGFHVWRFYVAQWFYARIQRELTKETP